MKSVAITDHGWMAGVVKFYKECKKEGIHPILGCEAYCTLDPDGIENKTKDNYHLVLLAKNNQGYKDLLRLCSEAAMHNFYYKPRIYLPKLEQAKGNIIAATACLGGPLAVTGSFSKEDKKYTDSESKAKVMLSLLRQYIQEGDLYLEIQDWDDGTGQQYAYNEFLLELGEEYKLPSVITCDAHYLNEGDSDLHEMMMAMQFGKTIQEYREQSTMKYSRDYWIKPSNVMLESAKRLGCPDAYYNTNKIAEECNVELELGNYYLPTFDVKTMLDYQEFLQWNTSKNNM